MSSTNRLASLYYGPTSGSNTRFNNLLDFILLLRTEDFQIRYLICISSYTENIKPVSVLYSNSVTRSPRGMQCPGLYQANGDMNQLGAWLDSDPKAD